MRCAMVLLCLCAGLAQLARAQDPAAATQPLDLRDIGAPAFTNFSARDGLPHAVMTAVRTDREGFVWAASPAGVFRYDGKRWTPSEDPAMAHPVHDLWIAHDGTLWAASRSHGLARHDGTRWHVENRGTGLPSDQIRRLAETVDAQGTWHLYALTWDRGLLVRRDGRWEADPGNRSLPRGPLLAMAQTRHLEGRSREWVGTGNNGLWYRDTGTVQWEQWQAPSIDSAQVEFLLAVENGGREELWMSVFSVGVWQLSDTGVRTWSKDAGTLPTNETYDIGATGLPGGERGIWISTRSGVVRIHDGDTQVFDRRHGLASGVVRGLNVWRSPEGRDVVWLATEAGISRTVLGASPWSTASLMGAGSTGVFGLLVEPDGRGGERLWVGATEEGLGVYDEDGWHHYTAADGSLPAASISMVDATTASDGTRTRWLGLRGGELVRVHEDPAGPRRFERIATPWQKVTGEAVLDVEVVSANGREDTWFGTRQAGAWRWRDGRWTSYRPVEASGQWRVGQFVRHADAGGRTWLWASTSHGLARFDGTGWTLFGRDAGLPDENLMGMSLIPDDGGRPVLWLGTSSAGMQRVDISDPSAPVVLDDTLPPPPDPTAYGALADSRGRIYVCTNNGVQQLTPTPNGFSSRVYTRRDGMVHDECNTNAQFIDAHDRYWTGTLGGLTVYDPGRESADTHAKPLLVTAVRVDGDALAGADVQMPANARALDVEFALLSWYRESESRFRTWLVGLEDAPGPWTAQASRSFHSLPPGDYLLRVEARDHAGNESTPVELPISVAAQWWEQAWARALAVLALVLAAYALVRWRLRVLHAQRDELEQRVAARTAELDEANARLLDLSYRDALTGLANRRRFHERLAAATETASGIATPTTALILLDVDHFKEFNDRHGHPAGDEALRNVADVLRGCAPERALVARYGGEEFACLLPDAGTGEAAALAERMRVAMQDRDVGLPGETEGSGKTRVTLSAGVASGQLSGTGDVHHIMREADKALYRAKREGRNRVCTAVVDAPPV